MFDALKHLIADGPEGGAPQPHWLALRRPPRECDRAITGTTRQWLRRLPSRRRPLRLCIDFPRVANRIAWCWHDGALSEQLLQDLLVDRRGGREGFPAPVVRELQRLREFNAQKGVETRPEGWWDRVARVTLG
jgi:hypothetical protein